MLQQRQRRRLEDMEEAHEIQLGMSLLVEGVATEKECTHVNDLTCGGGTTNEVSIFTVNHSLPEELSDEDKALLERSSKATGDYMWLHTTMQSRGRGNQQEQQYSLLVDSGNPLELLIAEQQLPPTCELIKARDRGYPNIKVTICGSQLISRHRALVNVKVGHDYIPTVATVYNEDDLRTGRLPPILGFAFLKHNNFGFTTTPMIKSRGNKRSTIRLDAGNKHIMLTARVPCGQLLRITEGNATPLVDLHTTTKCRASRQFTLLASADNDVQCLCVDCSEDSTTETHQVSTCRDELLQPFELQALKVDATAFTKLQKNDLLVIEQLDSDVEQLGVLVMSGVTDIQRPGMTATIIVLNLNRSPFRLSAGTPIAAASRFNKLQEIRDVADRPIRFAFVDGKLAWTGEDFVHKKVLLAEAESHLHHEGIFNPRSPEGRLGIDKLLQLHAIQLEEAGVDLEDEQAVKKFIVGNTVKLRKELQHRESSTAKFLGVGTQGQVVIEPRPSGDEPAGVSTSSSAEPSVDAHLTDREELQSPRSGESATGSSNPPEPSQDDGQRDTDPMTRKLRRCPPAFQAELRRISDPQLRAKVIREVTYHEKMSKRVDGTASVSEPIEETVSRKAQPVDVATTTTQTSSSSRHPLEQHTVVEDALRVKDDMQKRAYTKEDVDLPEVRDKMRRKMAESKAIPEDLTREQKQRVSDMLYKNADLFVNDITFAGPTDPSFEIDLEVMEPKGSYRSHNIPWSMKSEAIIRQVLEQYLLQGIIAPTNEQQWTSPVFTLRKAGRDPDRLSSYRVLSDLRFVNAHIKNNIHNTTVPMIKRLFARFQDASWAALFDLTSGYTQLKLNEKSRRYTAFSAPPPLPPRMAFVRCPQGLACLPGQFMSVMHRVLGSLCNTSVLVYLDDMVTVASSFDELLVEVQKLFDRLREHNMALALSKSIIGTRKFDFLGHHFDLTRTEGRGVTVQHRKVQAILQAKMPEDVSALRALLGTFQYYKDFIPGYSSVAAPLHKLTSCSPSKVVVAGPPNRVNSAGAAAHAQEVKMTPKQEKKWISSQKKKKGKKRKAEAAAAFVWLDDVHGAAIRTLQRCLTEDVVLKIHSCHPDALLRIRTDASNYAIGSVLEQLEIDGPLIGRYRPIGFHSAKLKDVETRWSATERECFGVISALEHWHQFICGRPVSVYCDHKALQYVFSPDYQCSGSTRGRLFRWRARAARYGSLELYYVRGSLMESSGPDFLSRMDLDETIEAEPVPLVDVLGELDPPEDEVVFHTQHHHTHTEVDDGSDPHAPSDLTPVYTHPQHDLEAVLALTQCNMECEAIRQQVQATADSVEYIVSMLTQTDSLDVVRDADEPSSKQHNEQTTTCNNDTTEVTVEVGVTTRASASRQRAGTPVGDTTTSQEDDASTSTRLRNRRRGSKTSSGEGEQSENFRSSSNDDSNNAAATTAAASESQTDTTVSSQATKAVVRRCLDGSTRDDLLWKLLGTRNYWSVLERGLRSATSPKDVALRDAVYWLRRKRWPSVICERRVGREEKRNKKNAQQLEARRRRAEKLAGKLRINDRDVLVYEAREGAMCLVTPQLIQREMIQYFHDAAPSGGCHRSVENTFKAIAQCCYWPSLWDDVTDYVHRCDHCQRFKHSTNAASSSRYVTGFPMYNMEKVAVDHIVALPETKNGNKNILVIIDLASRWAVAVPLKTVSIQETADAFVREFVCNYGVPRTMVSDNGVAFEAELARRVYGCLGVHQNFASALHPQSNGAVERLNGTLKTLLRMMANENADDWDEVLPLALMAYRNAVHRSTGVSPYELLFGRPMRVPVIADIKGLVDPQQPLNSSQQEYVHLLEERITTQLRSAGNRVIAGQLKRNEGQGGQVKQYPVGSRVFARIGARAGVARKLAALYRPGTVTANYGNGGHVVRLDGDDTFMRVDVRRNSNKLKPCWFERNEVLGVPSTEGDRLFEVDGIEDVRRVENVRGQAAWQVRVAWAGYKGPERLSPWKPIEEINPAGLYDLLQEFKERNPGVAIPLIQKRGSRKKSRGVGRARRK